ncbi:hypothetical protein PAPYR_745 [Paratrimastix pyriformis]|uniref:RRM domain-containing protein n=1 Tax=Paratrimastix pyriformis TaxID=342808 RepID=A0ABQ8UUD0_9EUKA|nr:hypothetical protein PAPYR_745 [Paratrimastix pyriformis]
MESTERKVAEIEALMSIYESGAVVLENPASLDDLRKMEMPTSVSLTVTLRLDETEPLNESVRLAAHIILPPTYPCEPIPPACTLELVMPTSWDLHPKDPSVRTQLEPSENDLADRLHAEFGVGPPSDGDAARGFCTPEGISPVQPYQGGELLFTMLNFLNEQAGGTGGGAATQVTSLRMLLVQLGRLKDRFFANKRRPDGRILLLDIPRELLVRVFSQLDGRSLLSCSHACHYFIQISNRCPALWKGVAQREFTAKEAARPDLEPHEQWRYAWCTQWRAAGWEPLQFPEQADAAQEMVAHLLPPPEQTHLAGIFSPAETLSTSTAAGPTPTAAVDAEAEAEVLAQEGEVAQGPDEEEAPQSGPADTAGKPRRAYGVWVRTFERRGHATNILAATRSLPIPLIPAGVTIPWQPTGFHDICKQLLALRTSNQRATLRFLSSLLVSPQQLAAPPAPPPTPPPAALAAPKQNTPKKKQPAKKKEKEKEKDEDEEPSSADEEPPPQTSAEAERLARLRHERRVRRTGLGCAELYRMTLTPLSLSGTHTVREGIIKAAQTVVPTWYRIRAQTDTQPPPSAELHPQLDPPGDPTAVVSDPNSISRPTDRTVNRKIFVGGLRFETDVTALRTHFSRFGEILDCKIIMDTASRRSKGFAFIVYANEQGAIAAITSMNNAVFDTRVLRVEMAENPTESTANTSSQKRIAKKQAQAQRQAAASNALQALEMPVVLERRPNGDCVIRPVSEADHLLQHQQQFMLRYPFIPQQLPTRYPTAPGSYPAELSRPEYSYLRFVGPDLAAAPPNFPPAVWDAQPFPAVAPAPTPGQPQMSPFGAPLSRPLPDREAAYPYPLPTLVQRPAPSPVSVPPSSMIPQPMAPNPGIFATLYSPAPGTPQPPSPAAFGPYPTYGATAPPPPRGQQRGNRYRRPAPALVNAVPGSMLSLANGMGALSLFGQPIPALQQTPLPPSILPSPGGRSAGAASLPGPVLGRVALAAATDPVAGLAPPPVPQPNPAPGIPPASSTASSSADHSQSAARCSWLLSIKLFFSHCCASWVHPSVVIGLPFPTLPAHCLFPPFASPRSLPTSPSSHVGPSLVLPITFSHAPLRLHQSLKAFFSPSPPPHAASVRGTTPPSISWLLWPRSFFLSSFAPPTRLGALSFFSSCPWAEFLSMPAYCVALHPRVARVALHPRVARVASSSASSRGPLLPLVRGPFHGQGWVG